MSSVRVEVEPRMLNWAVERSGREADAFDRFPLEAWVEQRRAPTLKQLEDFAKTARTPIGALLLPEPPTTELPLTDYRTLADRQMQTPSVELSDVVLLVERRQEWLRSRRQQEETEPLGWVGSVLPGSPVDVAAAWIMTELDFTVSARPSGPILDTRAMLVEAMENQSVLVTIAGFVGSTHRRLDVEEFRGFCLVDDLAPAIFVNGRDSKAGQLFTLLHEYTHLLCGESALDLPEHHRPEQPRIERWCNEVAAEVLAPREHLESVFEPTAPLSDEVRRLHGIYRASGQVILSQLVSVAAISWEAYEVARDAEREAAMQAMAEMSDGGNYYNTKPHMVGRPLLAAVAEDVRRGRTSTTEAMSLLQVRSYSTLEQLMADV